MKQRYNNDNPWDEATMQRDKRRLDACKFISLKSTRNYIFEKYGKKCLCCGSEGGIHLDHVIPVIKNGIYDDLDNLQPLCKRCNSLKGTKVIDYRKKGGGI